MMSVSTVSSSTATAGERKSLHLDDTNFHHRPSSLNRHSVYRFPVPVDDQLDAVVIDTQIASTSSAIGEGGGESLAPDDVFEELRQHVEVAEEHVYANMVELEKINRRPVPPTPDPDEKPIRVMPNGWREYRTKGGRSYFYCPESKTSQWKPPRMLLSAAQVNTLMLSRRASEDDGAFDQCMMKPSQVAATLDSPTVTPPTPRKEKHSPPMPRREIVSQQLQCKETPEEINSTYDYRDDSISLATLDDLRPDSPPLEMAPAKPPTSVMTIHEEQTPASSAQSSPEMVNSVDSGISRGSISYRNQGYGLSRPPIIHHHNHILESGNGSSIAESVSHGAGAALAAQSIESLVSCIPGSRFSTNFSQKTIKSGNLEKCKIAEGGLKLKKREWAPSFIFLSSAHLIFYKDEKSAERHGKHYSAPLGMCDLRGSKLMWADKDKVKDKRRKHVFLIELAEGTEYLFSSAMPNDINGWFHALRQVVSKLPQCDVYPSPICVFEPSNQVLQRNGSSVSFRAGPPSGSGSPFSLKNFRHSTKAPIKATVANIDPMSSSMIIEPSASNGVEHLQASEHHPPSRDSIIERLKRFFRTRPSVEALREKGIYRPEPVFGSTMQTICNHECSKVPKFIRVVTEVIEAKGLDMDGLYRVSGNLSSVQKIRCRVDQDDYRELLKEEDVHVLTGALKLFFRELSEPLFPTCMAKDFLNAIKIANGKQKFKTIDDLLLKLPLVNRETLKVLLKHLQKVANHSDQNRMQIHSLAIMFGPTLFSCDDRPASQRFNGEKKKRKSAAHEPPPAQPSQNLAFVMIQQGQVVEYILQELNKFTFMKTAAQ